MRPDTTTATHVDPVCGMSVEEGSAASRSTHKGTEYYFCSVGCKKKFDSSPEQYLGPGQKPSGGCCCG